MHPMVTQSCPALRRLGLLGLALAVTLAPLPGAEAQSPRKVLTIEDYARWKSIDTPRISGDGNWAAYVLRHPNALDQQPVLHLRRIDTNRDDEIASAVPFLIMHGTADPVVAFQEGLGFYNALRFNGKIATLLAYPGEGHGLRGLANRRDLTIRYFQFFDHYLRGAPAPRWLTEGVPFLEKDLRRDASKDVVP